MWSATVIFFITYNTGLALAPRGLRSVANRRCLVKMTLDVARASTLVAEVIDDPSKPPEIVVLAVDGHPRVTVYKACSGAISSSIYVRNHGPRPSSHQLPASLDTEQVEVLRVTLFI
jgi:hypothetical protein